MGRRELPAPLGAAVLIGLNLVSAAAVAAQPDGSLDARVTIEEFANRTEETYWRDQYPAAVKITPRHAGAPYYLVDPDADGAFEVRRAGADIDNKPAMWKLLAW